MKYIIAAPILSGLLIYLVWNKSQNTSASGNASNFAVPAQFAGTNPAHGQAGHRCDLAVGAPLPSNSAPAASPAPASSQVSIKPSNTITAAPAANPQINPAHGEPGHRCDIAVGAPLTANTSAASPQVFTPQAASQATTSPSTPKPKINPEHGQPWHRCDLQVGAPLT